MGLHRELGGEQLTGMRFIQCFAVDHLIALLRLTQPSIDHRRDPFEPTRRIEHSSPPHVLPLSEMVRGYDGNVEAARTILDWLCAHFQVDPAMEAAIGALLPPAVRVRDVR